jgi:hypothetical protein
MIVETCPRCGTNLVSFVLTCDPPVPKKYCPDCGWSWTGEPEEIVRVPFGGNSYTEFNMTRHCDPAFANSPCRTCSNNPVNGGSGICFCTLGQPKFTY